MTSVPAVRAVVVTWNGAHLLPACLGSLIAQRVEGGHEVLVVDNASTDGTADPADIAAGLRRAVGPDGPAIGAAGLTRSAGFTWTRAAELTMAAYRAAV